MKIAVLIPARSGSEGIPNKNIRMLGNNPLMVHSILTGLEITADTYVSTDTLQYSEIAERYGARVIDRPAELSGSEAPDFPVIEHFLEKVDCDQVIYLRPTTPFRTLDLVKDAMRLMSVPGYDSLRSVELMAEGIDKCFRMKMGILTPIGDSDMTDRPRQDVPATYRPNGYVDIVRSEVVRKGTLWGRGRYGFVTPRTVEIDEEEDFEYAEWLVTHRAGRFEKL